MRLHYVLLLAQVLCTSARAQTGNLRGHVVLDDGQPAAYATVGVVGAAAGTSTDAAGDFLLETLPVGTIQLAVNLLGYQSREITAEVLAGQTTEVSPIELVENITELQTVEITGRRETGYRNRVSYSGTKSATPLKDIPQSIGYVTKELALDQAAFRLNDVVKNISGVNQYSFYNDITIRGFRVSGQENSGNLTNGMRSFTSFWKQQLIPHIERVEVIKGPASALFGNASPGGTINRVTKKPLAETRRSVSTTVGSFSTLRTLADFTGKASQDGSLLYRLNLGYENSGSFRDLQYDKNLVVAPSFSFLPNEKTRLNVDLVYQGSEGRLDRGQAVFGNGDLYSVSITKSLNAANDFLREESVNATISLNHQLAKGLSFSSTFLHSTYDEDLQEHRTSNTFAALADGSRDPELVEMRVFIRQRNWTNDNFNNYLNYEVVTGPLEHRILVGHDYFQQKLTPGGSQLQARGYLSADRQSAINTFNADQVDRYALDAGGNPIPNVPHFDLTDPAANQIRDLSRYFYKTDVYPQSKQSSHGIYFQDQVAYKQWQLLLALRREYFTDVLNFGAGGETKVTQSVWLPRVGLVYTLSDHINLYGTYVRGYQPQTASVVNDPNAGGPFDALESRLLEVGAKSEWIDGRLGVTLAVYTLNQAGGLYPANDPGRPDLLRQIGEERSRGAELDVSGRITSNWSIVASYAYTDAEITASDDETEIGRQKPNAPTHAGNLWTKYVISRGSLSGLGLGAGINFVSERLGSLFPANAQPPIFPGYELANLAGYYQVNKFRFQINLNNVFDQTHWVGGYDYIRAFPGSPRAVLTTVSYTF